MITKTIRLIHLLCYLVVTSQLLFYLVVFSDALRIVPIENYLEHRKSVDSLISERYKLIYFCCLAFSFLAVILSAKRPVSVFFITSMIALLCLTIDVVIALKGNVPLNHLVNNGFTQGSDMAKWEGVRTQWLTFIQYRGVFSVIGMSALLSGLIFEK